VPAPLTPVPGPYLAAVRERVVVWDGAMGTNLQLRNLGPDDFGGPALEGCNELLVVSRPDVVADVHRSFLEVGCDVIETDSFGSLPWVLAEYGIAERTRELARRSAELAREVVSGFPGRLVAGSLGPGTKIASLGQIAFVDQRDGYEEAAAGLLEGGVDVLVIETIQDLLQAKAAIIGCRRAMAAVGRDVPIQVQVTIETTGRMLMGTEIGAALTTIDALHPDVLGLNCATGPVEMSEHLRYLSAHSRIPIAVQPNAGLPSVVDGRMHYDLTPDQLAAHHARFVTEYGIGVVGGCCGTEPRHLAAVVDACASLTPTARNAEWEPGCASIYTHVPYDQSPSFLVVGERTNANGSKKFREAMLADDWDTCVSMAREAVKGGAHVLDVCVDYTGEDGVADMAEVAARFATQATLPIMLDSTEPPVIEAGLQRIAGKVILNSVNLEDGDAVGTRLDGREGLGRDGRPLRRRPLPGLPPPPRSRRRDDRGPRRAVAPPDPRGLGLRRRGRPDPHRPVPPAVPGRPVLVGLPRLPRPRGQRQVRRARRRRADRRRGQRGVVVAVPPRTDHRRHHLPPPAGQVLRGPPVLT
jgi:5-methyltetrahydrofolate--homocysteine methyltransferase